MIHHEAAPVHNAHFTLAACMDLAEKLKSSGGYDAISLKNHICCYGVHYAQVYVEHHTDKATAHTLSWNLHHNA